MSLFAILRGLFSDAAPNLEGRWTELTADGRKNVDIITLYESRNSQSGGNAKAALLRYKAGAVVPRHRHPDFELILVLTGTLRDDYGVHSAGTLVVYPPGSEHSLSSVEGCLFLVVWQQPVERVATFTGTEASCGDAS
jgi:quercetin dioxygenase-like cupin family protein